MRLTLRTILAYLDDVLEPAQARELGEKIAEGKEASALVAKIRDVSRRRRIGAPELSGPGSGPDPNIVSDYLENLLSPNQVMELERLCQTSDTHLAEVAGCHKILTMVLGQPIDVADDIRERMYALGTAKSADQVIETATPSMTEGIGETTTSAFQDGLPDYLKRRSFLQQYGTVLSIMAVAGIWMGIVITDRSLWERPESQPEKTLAQTDQNAAQQDSAQQKSGQQDNGQQPLPAPEQPAVPQPDAAQSNNAADPMAMPGNGAAAGAIAATTTPMPATPAPVAPAPVDPTEPIVPPVTPDAPQPDPSVAAMTLPVGETPAPNMTVVPTVPVAPETLPELRMAYLSGDEFIIQPHAVDPGWYVSTRELPVEVGDTLVSPPPFRNSYQVADAVTVGLQPGTRIQRLLRRNNSDVAFLLEQGQITLTRLNDSQNPVTVRLRVFGQDWFIKLLEPGTRVGVELVPTVPNGPPTDRLSVVIDGGIVVVEGKASVSTAGTTVVELGPADGFVHWPAGGSTLVPRMDFNIPAWATVDGPFVTAATRQFGKLFQKEFHLEQTVEESLAPIAKDRRAGLSEPAVKTLALIGDWEELVPALKNDHQESRLAAITGLRHWLALNPGREPELRETLSQNFAEDKVNTIVRLLWGFNEEDARSDTASAMLVGGLKDDDIAVRELAFQYISKLTARTFDYLPMAPLVERRAAINRWEEYLKRNNGALISD